MKLRCEIIFFALFVIGCLLSPTLANAKSAAELSTLRRPLSPDSAAVALPAMSAESDIVYDGTFSATTNIPYINHTDPTVTINEHHLAHFRIRDGGATGSDADATETTLTDITFSITNWTMVKDIAIFDFSNALLESGTVSGPTFTFSGLSLSAADDSDELFKIVCTFQNTVTDKAQITITVISAITQGGGSDFTFTDAGGASSLGSANFIEVVATEMQFATQPQASINVTTDFSTPPVVNAQDINGNVDLDFNDTASVDTPMSLNLSNPPTMFTAGVLTFPSNFQYTEPGDGTLSITTGLGTISSTAVAVACIDPVIFTSITNSSDCSPYNGSVTLTLEVDGVPELQSAFSFEWFTGTDNNPVNSLGVFTGDNSGMAPGDYYVEATFNLTGCVGGTVVTINDVAAVPVILEASNFPDATCVGTPSGSVTMDVGAGNLADYTIAWYEGASTITPLGTTYGVVSGANNETAMNLPAGMVTVEVTDNTTPGAGCSTITTFVIASSPEILTVENGDITITSNTTCSDPHDGSMTINQVTVDGTPMSPDSFFFEWLEPDGITPVASGSGLNSLSSWAPGSYFVRVSNPLTGCETSLIQFTIEDTPILPVLSETITHNASCASPEGSITIQIDGGMPVSNYTISWHEGNSNLGPLIGSDVLSVTGLDAGSYYVEVTSNLNQCLVSDVYSVLDARSIPANALLSGGGSICLGDAATFKVDVLGGVGPFSVVYDDGNGNLSRDSYTSGSDISVTPASAGTVTYSLISVTDSKGCVATTSTGIAVYNVGQTPDLNMTTSPNSSCFSPNGSASVSIDGGSPASGYTISWFEGVDNTGNQIASDVLSIAGLSPGNYFLEVTPNVSSCTNSVGFTISDIAFLPTLAVSSTNNTSCLNPNGSASLTINGGANGTGFAIEWKDEGGAILGSNTMILSNLSGGNYSVEVTPNGTDCMASADFTIDDLISIPSTPVIDADNTAICEGTTVNLFVSITGGTAPYTLTIDNGVGTISNYNSDDVIPVTPLTSTTYSITSLSDINGCSPTDLPAGVEIKVDPALKSFQVTGGGEFCENATDNITIQLGGSQSAVSYSLLLDGNEIASRLGNGNSLVFTVEPVEGEYTIEAISANDCMAVMSGSALVTLLPLPTLEGPIEGDVEFCQGAEALSYSIGDPGNADFFTWSIPDGFSIIDGKGTNQITVSTTNTASSGDLVVTATNDCGTSESVRLSVTSNPAPALTIEHEAEIRAGEETIMNVSSDLVLETISWDFGDGGSASESPVAYTYGNQGNYTVEVSGRAENGCIGTNSKLIPVKKEIKIGIKNVVTPNGDGQNDILWIDNIENYPENELRFLDRWGVEVASFKNYQNTWDLKNEGEYIPAGNYLCVVRLGDGDVYSMTITVIRN